MEGVGFVASGFEFFNCLGSVFAEQVSGFLRESSSCFRRSRSFLILSALGLMDLDER